MRRTGVAIALLTGAMLAPAKAHALELPKLFGKHLVLDVTEVSIVSQRFDSRQVDPLSEGGAFGEWINRLNATLDWNHFQLGMRLDSAVYWNTLAQQCGKPTDTVPSGAGNLPCSTLLPKIARDDLSRYQNSIYPAKLWASYKHKGIEITLGDAYVQFARGIVLSMRKLDDLGIDNTVRGIKASVTRGPFGVTVIAGLANPSRVDEATGEALFNEKTVATTSPAYSQRGPQPVFGADQIFGAEIQAGRDSPVVLTTSMAYLNRCAPNSYTGPTSAVPGRVYDPSFGNDLVGYCDDADVSKWLGSLPGTGTIRQARHVTTVAESIEFPKMKKFGTLYLVGAVQHREGIDQSDLSDYGDGSALYATYTGSVKNVTTTVELKDYRNFYPDSMSADATQVSAFSQVSYSAPPTIESITQDNMLGNFNVCATGARVRTDVNLSKKLLVYGQGIFTWTRGEQNALCDRWGNLTSPDAQHAGQTDYVVDGLLGVQYEFEKDRSHVYATVGARQDWLGTGLGDTFLQQPIEITYNLEKAITKKVAIELLGRHRVRYEAGQNVGPSGAEYWVEGENYLGLSIAPKWVITQGFEYSTFNLPAGVTFAGIQNYPSWLYLSLGGTYKFTKDSNLRVFVGQQRGGLKCISGICRVFPPFEGARAELTVRF
ncbi:MAG TPA: DUF6029 family protein [Polyangiaceae bacterium]